MYIYFFFDSRSQYDCTIETWKLERSRDRKFVNPHKEEPKILIGASVPDLPSLSLSIYIYKTIHLYLARLSLLSASSYYRYRLPD